MQAPQGQSSNETEKKVVEIKGLGVKVLKDNLERSIAGESTGGQTPPHSSASSAHNIPTPLPRIKTSGGVNAKLESEDGQQVDAKLEEVRQENDLDDKSTLDSPPPPSSTSVSTNPFGDEFDSEDDEQEEQRVEGSVGGLVNDILSNGSSGAGNSSGRKKLENFREHIYSTVRPKNDRNRQVSVGLSYSEHNPQAVNLKEECSEVSSNSSGTPSTGSPSVFTDNSQEPLLQGRDDSYVGGNDIKKTKRSPLRAKYAVQQANFVIPVVSAAVITIYTIAYATSVYLQDKGSLIAFIINNPKFITVPGIIALSLFAIGIFCAVKQFRNTIEHQIDEKDPDKILKKVLEVETKGQIIRHLTVEHSDGTILHYRFNTWEANKNGIANVDKEVIRKVGKIESVINDRPLFTALFTGFIVANVALPLWLYAAGGISNITTFYQSILATNVGLLSLVATGMFVLSIVYLGIRNYKQTSCTNVVYLKDSETSNKEVNEKLLDEAAEQRISATKECHDQTGKVESLRVTKVDTELFNGPTHSIACY